MEREFDLKGDKARLRRPCSVPRDGRLTKPIAWSPCPRQSFDNCRRKRRPSRRPWTRGLTRRASNMVSADDDVAAVRTADRPMLDWRSCIPLKYRQRFRCGRMPIAGRWRSGRDSNPRYGFAVYSLSRRAPSTTRPPLRMSWKHGYLEAPAREGKLRGRPAPREGPGVSRGLLAVGHPWSPCGGVKGPNGAGFQRRRRGLSSARRASAP
jgi:hypothetical protein